MEDHWFTESCEEGGSALSLRIKAKLHEEHTGFQKIEIYETTHFGRLMVIDGFIMLSSRDNFIYHEMLAHPTLYTHPLPKRVAIIGGGDCGTLREVLRHPEVSQVTQVDIDERVTRISEIHFPELCVSNKDPRVEFLFTDGFEWIKNLPAGALDVIIVDSTDPIGPGEVLFSRDFYTACERALAHGGLMVQQSESPLLHMDILQNMHRGMKKGGFSHLKTLFFPVCVYPSGWWSATMARKGVPIDNFRQGNVENSPVQTRYYNSAIHQGAFSTPTFFPEQLNLEES
ncbi:MAG: polyamine aminopropyltransferase [Gammaproteobacteria bacterium]|nr:polyamine aminopropyltransferase [Gammaproteobacteria bacterium]